MGHRGQPVDLCGGCSQSLATVRLSHVNSAEIKDLAAAGERWLRDNAPSLATEATGLSMAYSYITERNIRSMLRGTFVALVFVSLFLVVVLRSVRIGLVSLLPNLIPAAIAFGLWGYLNSHLIAWRYSRSGFDRELDLQHEHPMSVAGQTPGVR